MNGLSGEHPGTISIPCPIEQQRKKRDGLQEVRLLRNQRPHLREQLAIRTRLECDVE
jgi:hypothetical protein